MKSLFFTVSVIILIACSCDNNGNQNTISDSSASQNTVSQATPLEVATDTSRLTGRWNLIPAMASDTATGRLPYLVFSTGLVSGNTGCNNFSGGYKQLGTSLGFDANMVTTRMACPGYDENAFTKNLLRTTAYARKGDTLVLKEDVTPLSYWLKEK